MAPQYDDRPTPQCHVNRGKAGEDRSLLVQRASARLPEEDHGGRGHFAE